MRLKFLFFPIMLVISVTIFLSFIWPQISDIKKINEERMISAEALKAIQSKKDAIDLIGTQISKDTEGKAVVNSYLPDKKAEERIIAGINYFATDAGVSLVNISLEDATSSASSVAQSQMGTAAAINASTNMLKTGEISADGQMLAGETPGIKFSEAKVSIVGEYSKIRLFVEQLQRMPIFNSIKSLTISNREDDSSGSAKTENVNTSNLLADIVIDFGYLKNSGLDNNKIAQFKPTLDGDTILTLKQYISQKTSSINNIINTTGSKGKTNPFLP